MMRPLDSVSMLKIMGYSVRCAVSVVRVPCLSDTGVPRLPRQACSLLLLIGCSAGCHCCADPGEKERCRQRLPYYSH